ncbi:four helix bundle protein [Mucilaginibacter sp.]|uniref:four helix bundle protein n=1 Tax=Mucilaginibacter sp. TaxID=1882438 RepID=UPI0032665FB3
MDKVELKKRTKKFTVDIIKFVESLPNGKAMNVCVNQLIRCSSSIGANYRAACRGKSIPDFINKIVIVEEEADESMYWLEVMHEADLVKFEQVKYFLNEANELTAIFTAIGKTAKENQRISKIDKSKNK